MKLSYNDVEKLRRHMNGNNRRLQRLVSNLKNEVGALSFSESGAPLFADAEVLIINAHLMKVIDECARVYSVYALMALLGIGDEVNGHDSPLAQLARAADEEEEEAP